MVIPDAFKHVIVDGSTYHSYMFRDNAQQAALTKQKFDLGIDHMRSLLINTNRYVEVRDTRVARLVNAASGSI